MIKVGNLVIIAPGGPVGLNLWPAATGSLMQNFTWHKAGDIGLVVKNTDDHDFFVCLFNEKLVFAHKTILELL